MLKISKKRSNLKYAVLALLSINFHGYGNFADHREVELFKLDHDALIAAKRQRFTVVAALAVLQDELNARKIDNTSFTRLALGMIVGNGDPIGVTTTLRYTPDEQNLVLGVIRNALSLLNMAGQVFDISQLWSQNRDAGRGHVDTLNDLARSTAKKDGAPVNFVTQVAQAYLTIEHRAARLRVGETSGLIEMALRYQSNPVYKKFLFVFIDLAPEAQQLVAQKFSSIPAGVIAAKDKQEIFVNLTRNPTTYIEEL